MKRRHFLIAGVLSAFGASSGAQRRTARIGILTALPRDKSPSVLNLLRWLSQFGYREGDTMLLEYRSSEGVAEHHVKLARELIEARCDLIFAIGTEDAARALRDLQSPIPAVFLAIDYDPVEKRIVDSFRRPGGNLTGVYLPQAAMAAKRLELAQELLPGAKRFLVLADVYSKDQLEALKRAAAARGAQLTIVEFARKPYDYAAAFETGRKAQVEAWIGNPSPVFSTERAEIAAQLIKHRLPSVASTFMVSEPAFLVSYNVDVAKSTRRVAEIGVRILKGAKPADIPVEQADEFELVINMKTAKALGVRIPYSVMSRATRLVE